MAFIGGIGIASGVVLVIALAVLAVGVTVFSRRSAVVDPALARTHFSRDGKPTSLAAVARSLDHVMCATELQSGEHFYFAPSFLYSYRFGRGQPAGLQLSTAVQASVCLPGAFAARRLPTAPYSFQRSPSITEPAAIPGQMLLTDGGVYDNMADQWLDGLAARVSANAGLRVRTSSVDEMVVVNSSAGPPWIPVSASWLPVRNELNTVLRVKDVQYAVSTCASAWRGRSRPGHYRYMLIDHLIYAAPDLTAAVADLEGRFGVRAQAGGSHTGLGTHNALLALGPRTYLEIIAPEPGQPAPPVRRPFGLDDLTGGALVSWALTCDDIDQAVAEAQRLGYDPGQIVDGQRVAPAGSVLRWRSAVNALDDDLIPFLICWGSTEHPARSAPAGLSLDSLRIEHPDPPSLSPALLALGADIEVTPAAAPALVATLSGPVGSSILR